MTGPRVRITSRGGLRRRWSAKIVHLRWKQRLGPVEIGDRLAMPASTVHAVLVRCRINRLTHLDRATGEPIRRYEHDHPGDLIHVDVKKLGRVLMVAAGASSAARRATGTGLAHRTCPVTSGASRSAAPATCTP